MSSSSIFDRFRRPLVWGRTVEELTLVEENPVGRGLMRESALWPAPQYLTMRPALGRDHLRLDVVRRMHSSWLAPWEATMPPGFEAELPTMTEYIRRSDRRQRDRELLVLMPEVDGQPIGSFTVSNVSWGVARMGSLGYWLAGDAAGLGLGATCAAMTLDLVIGELGLHRVEVCVRPENERSLGLCRRLGLYEEGLRPRYLHIAGQWADHIAFSADLESMPRGGWVARLQRRRGYDS
ncbi:MAG: GNAT family protein [Actinomycetaceae bacterium]|nr:GNAT family protein [Actinomycetaceae bacterium]